ncbi:ATP synthase subunit d, mitochondrial [Augochlora pura]
MARRAIRAIDWAAIAEKLGEAERKELAMFKAVSDQYLRRMTANPESPPKIDWAYYKKNISTPGLVDKFQKEYEAFSIPLPVDNYTAKIDADEKNEQEEINRMITEGDKLIVQIEKEVIDIKNLLPFEEMTLEDYAITYPDSALNVDKPTSWPHDIAEDEVPAETKNQESEGKADEKKKDD